MEANNEIRTPEVSSDNEWNEAHLFTGPERRKYRLSPFLVSPSTSWRMLALSSEEILVHCKRILFGCKSCVCVLCLSLHGSTMEDLPGREREATMLQEFLRQHIEKKTSGSICISGPPGIGRVIWLSKIMNQPEIKSNVKMVYINCTTIKSAAAIYIKIIQDLSITNSKKLAENSGAIMIRYLISNHKMVLLMLDGIEQLEGSKHVLYTIFKWPSLPNSKLIVLGITNTLKLTRFLPTLWSRCTLKPILIRFQSYTKDEIFSIISARLYQANASNVFMPLAVHKLAITVTTASKDLRQAMEISRRVMKLAKLRRATQMFDLTYNKDTNVGTSKEQAVVEVKPIDVEKVIPLLNEVLQLIENNNKEQDMSLFELKMLLFFCSFVLILKKRKNEDITFGMLYKVYRRVCKKQNMSIDSMEFLSLCSLTEKRGILRITYRKELNLSKVDVERGWSGWQEGSDFSLRNNNMINRILNDVNCL